MNEDRERVGNHFLLNTFPLRYANEPHIQHKRLRENIWAIPLPTPENLNPEFEFFWENCSDLGDDDFEMMREENEILKASIVY